MHERGASPTAADVACHYDRRYYDDLAGRYLRRSRFARQRIRNVLSLLPPLDGRVVVDLGCGIGTFAFEAARAGASAVGIDPMPEALLAARRVRDREGLRHVGFVRADAARLPLRTGSFDIAIAADLTEHLDQVSLGKVLAEAARVLRPGGLLAIYTPSPSHIFERLRARGWMLEPDPSHIGMRTAHDLEAGIVRAGLRVERVTHLPSHLPVWNRLEAALGDRLPLLRRRIGLTARKVAG